MKKIVLIGLVAVALVACSEKKGEVVAGDAKEVAQATETAKVYNLDTQKSTIEWKGEKLMGKTHHGEIDFINGNFAIEDGVITAGEFVVDMNTIKNLDLPEDGDYNRAMLEGHLKSVDFFDVENHPNSSFHITKVNPLESEDEDGNTHEVSGNFTIRGVAKEITFPAKINVSDDGIFLATNFFFNRLDWGVSYDEEGVQGFIDGIVKKGKDDFVKNEIGLNINLIAN